MAGRQPGLVGRTRPRPSRRRKRPTRLRAVEGGDCSAAPLCVVLQEAGDIGSLHPLLTPGPDYDIASLQGVRLPTCTPLCRLCYRRVRRRRRRLLTPAPVLAFHGQQRRSGPLTTAAISLFRCRTVRRRGPRRRRPSAPRRIRRPPGPSPARRRPLTAPASTRSRHPEAAQAGTPWLRRPGPARPARPSCHGRSGSCSTARPGPPR